MSQIYKNDLHTSSHNLGMQSTSVNLHLAYELIRDNEINSDTIQLK